MHRQIEPNSPDRAKLDHAGSSKVEWAKWGQTRLDRAKQDNLGQAEPEQVKLDQKGPSRGKQSQTGPNGIKWGQKRPNKEKGVILHLFLSNFLELE